MLWWGNMVCMDRSTFNLSSRSSVVADFIFVSFLPGRRFHYFFQWLKDHENVWTSRLSELGITVHASCSGLTLFVFPLAQNNQINVLLSHVRQIIETAISNALREMEPILFSNTFFPLITHTDHVDLNFICTKNHVRSRVFRRQTVVSNDFTVSVGIAKNSPLWKNLSLSHENVDSIFRPFGPDGKRNSRLEHDVPHVSSQYFLFHVGPPNFDNRNSNWYGV